MNWRRFWAGFALALAALTALGKSMPVSEQVRALLGTEYTPFAMGAPIAAAVSSCTYQGGGLIFIDGRSLDHWSRATVKCGKRVAILLQKRVGEVTDVARWKVVDTLLLPPIAYGQDNSSKGRLTLYTDSEGMCDVTPPPPANFFALVQWKNREKIDGRNGVQKAWTFDIDKEKIIPMSTRNISCEWTEP